MRAALPPLPDDLDYCVTARVHDCLPRRTRWSLFGALAGVSLGVALAFAVVGAWPVLPYSMLEIGVLGVAFALIERRIGDWERLTVAGDRVVVERERGGQRERHEFNRHWLRVDYDPGGFGRPARVTLRSSGEALDFGGALPAADLRAMAVELKRRAGLR